MPFFDVQPTMFTLNPPFGEIHGNELHLVYVLARSDFDVEAAANRTVGQVNQYLQSLQGSAEQLKGEIQQLVNSLIQKRKQERGTHSQIVAGLKIPVRQARRLLRRPLQNRLEATLQTRRTNGMSSFRMRVKTRVKSRVRWPRHSEAKVCASGTTISLFNSETVFASPSTEV